MTAGAGERLEDRNDWTAHRIEQTAGTGDLLNIRMVDKCPDFSLTTKRPFKFSAPAVVTAFWFQ